MKNYPLILLPLFMLSCTNTKEWKRKNNTDADELSSSASSKTYPVKASLSKALKYIDSEGAYVSVNDLSEDVRQIEPLLDKLELVLRSQREFREAPEELKLRDLFAKSKLGYLQAVSASSKKVGDGWVNKAFYDLAGEKGGLFSVFKGRGKEWGAYDFAPAGADLVVEFDLNVENLRETLEHLTSSLKPQDRGQLLSMFDGTVKGDSQLEIVAAGLHPRVCLVGELDRNHYVAPEEEIQLPNANFMLRVEGMTQLWEHIEPKLLRMSKKSERDGLVIYSLEKYEVNQKGNLPAFTPAFVLDKKADSIYFSTRIEYLEQALASKDKLGAVKEVKSLLENLSDSGNILSYVSHDLLSAIEELYNSPIGREMQYEAVDNPRDAHEKAMAAYALKLVDRKIIPALLKAKSGYVMTLDLNDDGILMTSKTPMAMKGSWASSSILAVPIAGAIITPVIPKQIARSRATQAVNNAKDIYVCMRDYAFARGGETPDAGENKSSNEHFRILFETGAIRDEKPFYVKGIEWAREGDENIDGEQALAKGENIFGYFPGANITNDSANTPLLIAPLKKVDGIIQLDPKPFGGQAVLLTTDGSVQIFYVNSRGVLIKAYGGDVFFVNGEITYTNYEGKEKTIKVALPEQ